MNHKYCLTKHHFDYHKEMLKHQIDRISLWAFEISFPDVCEVSKSAFF